MPKEDPFVNRAQLLKAIKKYPEIWDSNSKLHMCRSVTAPMWNEIAEQFGGHVPTVKLQSIWSQMKYHYHNLVHRQILHKDRFTTKWEHFEPMSFMYNITVAKIVGAAANATNATATTGNVLDGGGGDGQSGLISPPPPPLSLALPPPAPPSTAIPPPPATPTPVQHNSRGRPSSVGGYNWLPHATTTTSAIVTPPQMEINVETTPYTAFTGLVPPAVVTVETTTTPMRKVGRPGALNNSMRSRIIDCIRNHPSLWAGRQLPQPQPPQPIGVGGGGRGEKQSQNRTSAVWKEVAAELGLTPSLVQTRWSIIKQRYVDELQKERHAMYAQHGFQSTWEHFERMSFMREILSKKVDEREQTREQIQEIVSEQQHQQQQQQQQQHMRYGRSGGNGATNNSNNSTALLSSVPSMATSSHHTVAASSLQHTLGHESAVGAALTPTTAESASASAAAAAAAAAAAGLMLTPSSSAAMLHANAAAAAATLYHPQAHHHHAAHQLHHPAAAHHLQYHPIAAAHHHHAAAAAAAAAAHASQHHVAAAAAAAAHHPASYASGTRGGAGGRRGVKAESDLEWDPFEMILHVQGPEITHN